MTATIATLIGLLILYFIFEFRQRKPDQIVLYEKNNNIRIRKSRYYPRHFSLAISGSALSSMVEVISEAKGHLLLNIRIAVTVAASKEHIDKLIRAGGWSSSCITNALDEIKVLVESFTKEFCVNYEIEEISTGEITEHLQTKLDKEALEFGLNIISVNTQAVEPQEKEIILALQQQEEARIKEQTESARQKSRIAMAKAKNQADEQIIFAEHELEMKKLELQKKLEENEAILAEKRVNDDLNRKNLQLAFDKKEIELLKSSPELLMLSPQLARLAEASQQLPNAKTVVSLAQGNVPNSSQLLESIQGFLSGMFSHKSTSAKKESK